jgi:hypothetical protein
VLAGTDKARRSGRKPNVGRCIHRLPGAVDGEVKVTCASVACASPIAVLDVAYGPDGAGVACLLDDRWTAATPAAEISKGVAGVPTPYAHGEFYRRKLPLLRAVIDDLAAYPAALVIDGIQSGPPIVMTAGRGYSIAEEAAGRSTSRLPE